MFEISARRDGEGGATGCEVIEGHEIFGMVRMSPTYLPRRSENRGSRPPSTITKHPKPVRYRAGVFSSAAGKL
jgi:hypothetical protein